MDFQQFGIDERLLSGVPSLRAQALFHEKMLTHALKQGENVYARLSVSSGREAIYLLPALQWLASGQGSGAGRILCLVPDAEAARKSAAAALSIGSGIGLEACIVSLEGEGAGQPAPAVVAPVLEGNPRASFVTGSLEALLAARDLIGLGDFGYLLVDGAERIAELPSERIRHFSSALRPSCDRRAIVVCGRNSVKAKNLAWDLSENPVEFHVEEEAAKAQSVSQESWHIASDRKLRFLLGLLARRRPSRTCVFCNLKSGAEELALRLRYNGVEADYILGSLPADRKAAILADLEAEEGSVLVLTDEGAAGLKSGSFPLVVNYDIPLDPELYVKRLEMLDRASASSGIVNLACDRYVYGLPAVEQYIDASLDAKPVDESLLRAEDKSADLAFERPRFDREAPRGAPQVGKLVAADASRPARPAGGEGGPRHAAEDGRGSGPGQPRGEGRGAARGDARGEGHGEGHGEGRGRNGQRRGGRDDDYRQGRADRSPDIRRKIAEATGGSLDMDGASFQGEPAQDSRPRQQPGREPGQQPRQGGKSGKGGRGKGSGQGRDGGRPQGGRRDGGRGQGGEGQDRGERSRQGRPQQGGQQAPRDGGHAPADANPYSLSMEERMQRYREKYGQAGGQDRQSQPPRRQEGQGRSGGSQGQREGQPKGNAGKGAGRAAGKAEGASQGKPMNRPPKREPEGQGRAARGSAAPKPASPAAEPGKKGFLGKLFGSRKKKDAQG
jgi:ATP-dependent RNA helicase RhlB